MKICPNCHHRYFDNSLEFCLDDGARLVASRQNLGLKILSGVGVIIFLISAALLLLGAVYKYKTGANKEMSVSDTSSSSNSPAVKDTILNTQTQSGPATISSSNGEFNDQPSACHLTYSDSVEIRKIKFAANLSNINSETEIILQNLAPRLKQLPADCYVEIANYTDNSGNSAVNEILTEKRAAAIRNYLIALGVSADKLSARGYSDKSPAVSDETEEGRAINRRTEFKLIERKRE